MSDPIAILIRFASCIRFAIVPLVSAVVLLVAICATAKVPRCPSLWCFLGFLIGVGVITWSVWFISLVLEVSYEPTRNMIGFVIMPLIYGATIIIVICLDQRRRPSFRRVFWSLSGLAMIGFVVFYFGLISEMPYAYAFTLLRIRSSTSCNGVPISKIIGTDFLYWDIDGYFADDCGDYENLTVVRLDLPHDDNGYYFAYDNRTRVLVPMTEAAAELYPLLMPSGDELQDVGQLTGGRGGAVFGNCVLKLPVKWFHVTIQKASVPKGRKAFFKTSTF